MTGVTGATSSSEDEEEEDEEELEEEDETFLRRGGGMGGGVGTITRLIRIAQMSFLMISSSCPSSNPSNDCSASGQTNCLYHFSGMFTKPKIKV